MSVTNSATDSQASAGERAFYGKPFWWLVFAIVLLTVPAIGYMLQSGMVWDEAHPAINAMLNGSCGVFLVVGFVAIKRRNIELHKQCMIAAFVASSLFLASYLVRFAMSGAHRYPGDGADKIVYLVILFSHMLLAAAVVPMVLRTLFLAWRDRLHEHARIARKTWPVWIYVSVTGVIVYLMLYPIANALYGG